MFGTTNLFNGICGKVQAGMCRLTMNGNIAVKCSGGYKTYNTNKGRLTNVTNFCFDIGSDFFFVIPTCKVAKGDIILVDGKPKCVIEKQKNKDVITVIDYESSEIRQLVPERHVFMGSVYYYGKIVSMFGSSFKNGKGMGNMFKMMMFSQMMNGKTNGGSFGDMGSMMAMSMMMGGEGNMFGGLFDEINNGLSEFANEEDADGDDNNINEEEE
jgi:hypothetical protein